MEPTHGHLLNVSLALLHLKRSNSNWSNTTNQVYKITDVNTDTKTDTKTDTNSYLNTSIKIYANTDTYTQYKYKYKFKQRLAGRPGRPQVLRIVMFAL